jgi:hypothetical protein
MPIPDNPLFHREDRRLRRQWLIIALVYFVFWLPLNIGARDYMTDYLINTFFGMGWGMLIFPLYFLEVVLRPDLFFALILGRWICQQLLNPDLMRDLRLTLLSPREVLFGLLGNYLVMLCAFQLSGMYFIYAHTLEMENTVLRWENGGRWDFSIYVMFFAAVEDCTYAMAVLLIFVWELYKRSLSGLGVIVALLKVILLLIPLMIIMTLFEFLLLALNITNMSTPMEVLVYNAIWFGVSIPAEIALIYFNFRRIIRKLQKEWDGLEET